MATKNAKLMEKKITKPTISKPSNTVVRKVDKPRTAMTNLKKDEKSIKDAIASINYNKQYANTKRYNLNNELKANREKQTKVQKVIDSRTKANNKDLSKSLGNVANNKGMNKSDAKGTYKQAVRDLGAAKETASDMRMKYRNSTGVGAGAYGGMKRAEKDVKTQQKNVAELSKYNKGSRVPNKK